MDITVNGNEALLESCKELWNALSSLMRSLGEADDHSRNLIIDAWEEQLLILHIPSGFGKRAQEAIANVSELPQCVDE
jgi:hypothetical protein